MKSEEFWNGMAKRYDENVMRIYRDAYRDTVGKSKQYVKPDDVVLDIGCGSGITTLELAGSVREITAIDTAGGMIDVATEKRKKAGVQNVRYAVADAFDARWKDGAYDVVMAFNLLCYLKDMKSFLTRVHTLLKPGGIFVSATGCSGEHKTLVAGVRSLLGRIGVIPYNANFGTRQLEGIIRRHGFTILESCSLHPKPPNVFIAARK